MTRIELNFEARPESEQRWFRENTWCDACGEADLGMRDVREFFEDGKVQVEGHCSRCGGLVRTHVNEAKP
jgi:hypothetical protein